MVHTHTCTNTQKFSSWYLFSDETRVHPTLWTVYCRGQWLWSHSIRYTAVIWSPILRSIWLNNNVQPSLDHPYNHVLLLVNWNSKGKKWLTRDLECRLKLSDLFISSTSLFKLVIAPIKLEYNAYCIWSWDVALWWNNKHLYDYQIIFGCCVDNTKNIAHICHVLWCYI